MSPCSVLLIGNWVPWALVKSSALNWEYCAISYVTLVCGMFSSWQVDRFQCLISSCSLQFRPRCCWCPSGWPARWPASAAFAKILKCCWPPEQLRGWLTQCRQTPSCHIVWLPLPLVLCSFLWGEEERREDKNTYYYILECFKVGTFLFMK